jgi:hypothetical protein
MSPVFDILPALRHHFKLIRVYKPLILLELFAQFAQIKVETGFTQAEKLIVINFLELGRVFQILARVALQLFMGVHACSAK